MTADTERPAGRPGEDYRARLLEAVRTIERLKAVIATRDTQDEPIAVIGVGCRLPGGGDGPAAFWELLRDGVDATGDFPGGRADAAAWFDADPEAPGKSYTLRGGFLDQVDRFEPAVFGISPREAVGMDPQQRLSLEVAWEALEHAGYAPTGLTDSMTGVYMGVSTTDYVRMRQADGDSADIDAYQLVGEPSFVAGRISYTLGLRGPSKVIDTTCASSLVAVHDACQALRTGDCDMALAGGVNLMLSPYSFVLMSKFRALSPEGRCKTFDASADGYARGEGSGVVVLKRLQDALADGDRVEAVIRGTAVNHDGRGSGLTVPNPAAQQAVMRAALTQAGIAPADVDYMEAHGTGTSLGDPIELRSVQQVLGESRPAGRPLLIGSLKTNIGHLEAAAGIAGLIKVVLSLRHGQVPPHLHFERPNPNVDWSRLRMSVPTRLSPWPDNGHPKAGAVSSFGVSGTNAHAVLTEAPPSPRRDPARQRPVNVLTISARTGPALRELAGSYASALREDGPALSDACFTTHVGRAVAARGIAVAGRSAAELAGALEVVADGGRHDHAVATVLAPHRGRRLAWLFTGQGAQYAGMAAGLGGEPAFAAAIGECADVMDPLLGRPLRDLLESGDEHLLNQTRYTQPALFAVEYALARTWLSWGVRPGALLGHSVGEIVAACVAGVLSLPDAARLAAERGALMGALPDGGVMATLTCGEEQARVAVAGYPDTVAVAAVNGPRDTVISGRREDVEAVIGKLEADGVRHRLLRVSHAFHSPLMRPVLKPLAGLLAGLDFRPPQIPLVSNVSGTWWADGDAAPGYWLRHTMAAVRFSDGIQLLHADGFRTFCEVGPAPVLLGLGARCADDPECAWVPSLRRDRDARTLMALAVGTVHLRGHQVGWPAFHEAEDVRRVRLPRTPWHGESYWFPGRGRPADVLPAAGEPVPGIGRRLRTAVPVYDLDPVTIGQSFIPNGSTRLYPSPGPVAELSALAAADAFGGQWSGLRELTAGAPIPPGGDGDSDEDGYAVQLTVTQPDHGTAVIEWRGISGPERACGGPWREHARCVVARRPSEPGWAAVVEAAEAAVPGDDPVSGPAGPAPWRDPDTLLSQVEWHDVDDRQRTLEQAESGGTVRDKSPVLLVADRGGTADRLADELSGRGTACLVIAPPAAGGAGAAIAAWRDGAGPGGRVVVCTGLDAPGPADTGPDSLRAVRDDAELATIALLNALTARADCEGVRLTLLTRGAVDTGGQSRVNVAASTLWGLGRVIALEHPEHWGGLIDLDPDADTGPRLLVRALSAAPGEDQQALRGTRRLAARLVRRAAGDGELSRRPVIRPDGSYLITGGFGGIGQALARWLAEQGAGRLVLVARSPLPDRARWRDDDLDQRTADRVRAVLELERRGARVEVACADVADPDAMRAVVAGADTAGRPLRGVAHAAGVSHPQFLRDVQARDYDEVWRPKVVGGWNLHTATAGAELDFFLSFSSIASTWGSQHLASYAAGNAFLDGLAFHRRSAGLPALTVNWGPWDLPSALFGADVMEFLLATGLKPLAAPQCLRILSALLAGEHTQQVVCAADWATYKAVMEARADRPMLALIDTGEAGRAPGADSRTRAEISASAGSERLALIDRWLRRQLAQILRLDVADLAGEFHLLDMGLDSLMVMELISRCRGDLGVDFKSKDFFACDANLWAGFLLRRFEDATG